MELLKEETILHAPPLRRLEQDGIVVFIDPEKPHWVATDPRGARVLSWLDGRTAFGELVSRYAQEFRMGPAAAWLHVQHLVKEALRVGFISETPLSSPPYPGRSAYLGEPKLKELWIQINNACNLACAHCLVNSGPGQPPGLPSEKVQDLIDQAFSMGVERFYVTGGEPFLRKDLFDIIRRITDQAEMIALTNGTLLRGPVLEKLSQCNSEKLGLQISLDGPRPEINDPIRGKGSFERAVEGIQGALRLGFLRSVTTVINAKNADFLPELTEVLASLGVKRQHFLWLHHRGRAMEDGFEVPPEKILGKLRESQRKAETLGITIDNLDEMLRKANGLSGIKRDLSNAGVSSVCVYFDGRVFPSAALAGVEDLACGSILERPLEEIWRTSPALRSFREASVEQKKKCSTCHLKFICGGGDIEHSYAYSKAMENGKPGLGVLELDPYCRVHMESIEQALLKLALQGRSRLNQKSGFGAPVLYHWMGKDAIACGLDGFDNGTLPKVTTGHSNCVLSFEIDKPRSLVREFYKKAAQTPQAELCCPSGYAAEDVKHIPKEVLERFYGCGGPMSWAGVQEGETVVDLGSGGGIDCFIAAKKVGPKGKVYGIDMTDEMLSVARSNQTQVAGALGYDGVEFRKGYLEEVPLESKSVDLVTSNCVVNLSPDKRKVFSEIWRILKDHGRFVISDIVSERIVPPHLKVNVHLWGECLAGALSEDELSSILEEAGFFGIETLKKTFWKEVEGYRFFSVTVRGFKFEKRAGCTYLGQRAIYQGPFKATMDEEGHLFPRGESIEICTDTAAKLKQAPYRDSFTVIEPDEVAKDFARPGESDGCIPGGGCC